MGSRSPDAVTSVNGPIAPMFTTFCALARTSLCIKETDDPESSINSIENPPNIPLVNVALDFTATTITMSAGLTLGGDTCSLWLASPCPFPDYCLELGVLVIYNTSLNIGEDLVSNCQNDGYAALD